jgi:hypothetical protein
MSIIKTAAALLKSSAQLQDRSFHDEASAHGMDFESAPAVKTFFDQTIASAPELDMEGLDGHAKKLGTLALGMGLKGNIQLSRSMPQAGGHVVTVDDTSKTALTASDIDTESFDFKDPAAVATMSFAFNAMTSRQEEALELLFPSVVIPGDKAAVNVTIDLDNVINDITRNDGKSAKGKFGRVSLVQAYRDGSVLNNTGTSLMPVLDDKSKDLLNEDYKRENVKHPATGEVVDTAALKFGKTIPLIDVSQTPGQIAKGVETGMSAIDAVSLKTVYVNYDSGAEKFAFDVASYAGSNFVAGRQGEDRDIVLSLIQDKHPIAISTLKTITGAVSPTFSALPGNYTAYVRMVVTGSGNTEYGDIEVYGNSFELAEIKDAQGNAVDLTAGDGATIKAEIEKMTLAGYDVVANTTNADLKRFGDIVDVTTVTVQYAVKFQSPLTIRVPHSEGGFNDQERKLAALVRAAKLRTTHTGYKTLVEHARSLAAVKAQGTSLETIQTQSIGNYFTKAYYEDITVDVASQIDSEASGERDEDIQGLLGSRIKNAVTKMVTESGYRSAVSLYAKTPGQKIGVAVVCGSDVAAYVPDDMYLGADFEVKKVVGDNVGVDGKIFVTFFDTNMAENEASPLNYGAYVFAPSIVVDADRSVNGNSVKGTTTIPVSRHIVNLDILTEITVSNIGGALSKVTLNTHNA